MNKIFIICALILVGCASSWQLNDPPQDYELATSVEYNTVAVEMTNNTDDNAWCTGRIKGRTAQGEVIYSDTIEAVIRPGDTRTARLHVVLENFVEGSPEINCTPKY